MASTWEVKSTTKNKVTTTTAIYSVDGTTVATITGLKSGLTDSIVTSHIRVTEGEGGAAGTLTLDSSVLGTSKVTLTLAKGSKYVLALDETVQNVEIEEPKLSYASGKATVKGNLTEGYTLAANKKSISYSAAKTGQTLATVSGLATGLEANADGSAIVKTTTTETEGGESAASDTTETTVLTLGTDTLKGKILVTEDALAEKNATLKLDYANSGYQLAFGLDGQAVYNPQLNAGGSWAYTTSKGTGIATYTGIIDSAGYALSTDGKTVTYIAANEEAKALVKVSGVGSKDGIYIEEASDANYPFKITLGNDALTTKNVSISSGTGYQLALAKDYSYTPAEGEEAVSVEDVKTAADETTTWSMSKNVATYKKIDSAYYTYDDSTNKVTYHAPVNKQTLATVSGVNKNLVASGTNLVTKATDTVASAPAITVSGTTFTVADGALNKAKITLSDKVDGGYKLVLNTSDTPSVADGNNETTNSLKWAVSGTTATLTGNVTDDGYVQNDDNTITYAAKKNNVTLATVKGLAKGLTVNDKNAGNYVGTKETVEGETTYVQGIAVDDSTLTLANNVLGTTNVSVTSAGGFNYTIQLDDGDDNTIEDGGGAVNTSDSLARTFTNATSTNVVVNTGTEAYYTPATDNKSVTYSAPVQGAQVASLSGLKSNLKAGSDYQIAGVAVDSSTKKITLTENVLNEANVKLSSSNYTLGLDSEVPVPHRTTGWEIDDNVAYLQAYNSAGYTLSGKDITYSDRKIISSEGVLAEVSGLKKGLAVKADGSINGITVGEPVTEEVDGEDVTTTTIELGKAVLTTQDVTLDAEAVENGYRLDIASGVAKSTETPTWTRNNKGTVTYTLATSAGYAPAGDGSSVAYNKKSTVKVTITGLNGSALMEADTETETRGKSTAITDITGIKVEDGVITIDDNLLPTTDKAAVKISGGNYTLATDADSAVVAPDYWQVTDKKNVGTAKLYGKVDTAGYQTSADGKTITYLDVTTANSDGDDDGETETADPIVLTTITGLAGIEKGTYEGVNGITGITADDASAPTKFTLSSDVLGTSKVSISGGEYKLALDGAVPTATTEKTDWVTSGTTAKYKDYKTAYYTLDSTGSSIAYTAAKDVKTYATVKGVASGADLSSIGSSKTVTLTTDMLGTSNVTLSGSGYTLALANGVATTGVNAEEWVTSGTTATYKNYTRGYYTKSSDTKITYTAATKGTTIATIKGIASGAAITSTTTTDTGKVVTLGASQLGTSKVTISGDGYTLALGNDIDKVTGGDKNWNTTDVKNKKGTVTSVTATYDQTYSAGYELASNEKSITYSAAPTTRTLATIKNLAVDTAAEEDSETGLQVIDGITVDGSKIVISSAGLIPETAGSKVTLTSTDYTLDIDGTNVKAPEAAGDPSWTINKKKGTAAYKDNMSAGYTLAADGKSITNTATVEGATLLTVSGLNTTTLNKLDGTTFAPGAFKITADADGEGETESADAIVVDTSANTVTLNDESFLTKKVTLGKNDAYTFAFGDDITKPTAYTKNKWSVATVKKTTTTATLKDGIEAGYVLSDDAKTVTLQAEQAGDTLLTITGLKKGLIVSDDKYSVGVKVDGEFEQGITLAGNRVNLDDSVLGTTDVAVSGGSYYLNTVGSSAPGDPYKTWTFSNGTATYATKQNAGFTISSAKDSATYTPASSTTIVTVKGLKKDYDGDINNDRDILANTDQNIVTLSKNIVSTSKITATVPKNSTAYTLALADGIPENATEVSKTWVTSGTTATLKDYKTAYYTIAANGKSISYTADKNVRTYATVKGIKSGATVSDTDGVITLSKAQLAESNVSLSGSGYSLALASDVITSADDTAETTEWVTNGATATYKTYTPGYFTANSKNTVLTYKTVPGAAAATTIASVKGVTNDIKAKLDNETNTFTLSGDDLSKKVTISSGNASEAGPGFNFTGYNYATITGSKYEDNVSANGESLYISTAAGNDKITITGSGVSVVTGAGDDEITATGSSGSNVFIFAKDQGTDEITGFKATDAIKTTSGTPKAAINDGDVVITLGKGTITLEDAAELGTITINGKKVTPTAATSSNVLLEDNNYSADAAQLSSIVQPVAATYTPYEFDNSFSLTKEDKTFATNIAYSNNDK